nr:ABC transporter transmembrane domain-containing protein [Chloroflexota bacterium]
MKSALRILGYLKPYWRRLVFLYLSLLLTLGTQLAIPLALALAIDEGIVERDTGVLVLAAGLIVGLTLVRGVCTFIGTYSTQVISERVGFDLRNALYAHLSRLPFSFYDRAQTGQLMSRGTDDINNVRAMLMMTLRVLVLAIATLIGVTVILIRIDWLLALVALSTMPFLVWWSVSFGITIRPMFTLVQQQFGVMTSA